MIRLTDSHTGQTHFVSAQNVFRISEAPTSSQWHGIRSIVRLADGGVLECSESALTVVNMVREESEKNS